MTKTIPIWATVINRALANLKKVTSAASDDYFSGESLNLHLPHWISKNERNQVEQRVDTWVDELLALGVDLTHLQTSLKKPLRCVWISQQGNLEDTNEEENWLEIAESEELISEYTLLVLISASIPDKRQRRRLVIDFSSSGFSALSEIFRSISSSSMSSSSDEDVNGEYSNNGRYNQSKYKTRHQPSLNKIIFKEPVDLMYDYVPGAGDDEESWAKGLTPTLMWENIEELLRSGPEDIGVVVKRVVKSKKVTSDRAQKWTGAGARAIDQTSLSSSFGGKKRIDHGSTTAWKVKWVAGCVGIGLSQDLSVEILKKLGEEKESIAILNVGSLSSTTSLELLETNLKSEDDRSTRYLHVPVAGEKNFKRAVLHAVPAAVQFASNHLSSSSSSTPSSSSGCENSITIKNKLLVIAEPEAIDIAASIVVAILIACFIIKDGCIEWSRPAQLFPKSTTQLIPASSGDTNLISDNTSSNANEFTRTTVRQYLSRVSAYYPQVVLSKSLLKQIYNAFLPQSMFMVCPTSKKESA